MKVLLFDQHGTSDSIGAELSYLGLYVNSAGDRESFFSLLESPEFDIIVCDLDVSEPRCLELISGCAAQAPRLPVVVLGDRLDEETVMSSIRAGAEDCVERSVNPIELAKILKKIKERGDRKLPAARNRDARLPASKGKFVVHSERMKQVFDTAARLAPLTTTVLITGESGTGKELVAREIHQKSPRSDKPFIAINCGAIPENLVESELFGHKKGAFTDASRDKRGLFEEAQGGTIFLDEIGELPLHLQVKLLRALQEQQIRRVGDEELIQIDVRIVAATLRNLEDDVNAGRFRDDLFYRLNVVSINIPPLRERRDEIAPLVDHFLRKHNRRLGLATKGVSPEALELLRNHIWRGNVRELENCIERAMVLSESDKISVGVLPEHVRNDKAKFPIASSFVTSDDNLSIKKKTRELEINLITKALAKTKGNRTRAAKILEISHRALLYKLKEYALVDK